MRRQMDMAGVARQIYQNKKNMPALQTKINRQ